MKRPHAPGPAYRSRGDGAREPEFKRGVDVEACVALTLIALGCVPPTVSALLRGEPFSTEVTVCAFLSAVSLLCLLREIFFRPARRPAAGGGEGRGPGAAGPGVDPLNNEGALESCHGRRLSRPLGPIFRPHRRPRSPLRPARKGVIVIVLTWLAAIAALGLLVYLVLALLAPEMFQ